MTDQTDRDSRTLAAAVGAKPPQRIPRFLGGLAVGEPTVLVTTEIRGAANAKAKRARLAADLPKLARRLPHGPWPLLSGWTLRLGWVSAASRRCLWRRMACHDTTKLH
jgi:hypothetical protein